MLYKHATKILIAIQRMKQFQSWQSIHRFCKAIFHLQNLYFVNDEVRAGCPKLGHTTLSRCSLTASCIMVPVRVFNGKKKLFADLTGKNLYNGLDRYSGMLFNEISVNRWTVFHWKHYKRVQYFIKKLVRTLPTITP